MNCSLLTIAVVALLPLLFSCAAGVDVAASVSSWKPIVPSDYISFDGLPLDCSASPSLSCLAREDKRISFHCNSTDASSSGSGSVEIFYTTDGKPPDEGSSSAACDDAVSIDINTNNNNNDNDGFDVLWIVGNKTHVIHRHHFVWAYKKSYRYDNAGRASAGESVEISSFRIPHSHPVVEGKVASSAAVRIAAQRDRSSGGFRGRQRTASSTGLANDCEVAMNGGFFNTENGAALGNFVFTESNGVKYSEFHERRNVGLGGNSDKIVFGYIDDVGSVEDLDWFMTGCVWLVKEGVNYVSTSILQEDMSVQTSGSGQQFASLVSSRTAGCVTKDGKVEWVIVSGKTHVYGTSLYTFADYLASRGYDNCVNFDGGGSATLAYLDKADLITPGGDCTGSSVPPGEVCEKNISSVVCLGHLQSDDDDGGGQGIAPQRNSTPSKSSDTEQDSSESRASSDNSSQEKGGAAPSHAAEHRRDNGSTGSSLLPWTLTLLTSAALIATCMSKSSYRHGTSSGDSNYLPQKSVEMSDQLPLEGDMAEWRRNGIYKAYEVDEEEANPFSPGAY